MTRQATGAREFALIYSFLANQCCFERKGFGGRSLFLRILGITPLALAAIMSAAFASPIDKVVAANYAPYMIEGEEDRPGYAVEVLQEAARRSGRSVALTFLPFERAMGELYNSDATLMPALFFGKKRNDQFLWVVEIQTAKLSFATITGRFDDLDAARSASSIAVERGTTADVFLTNLGFENIVRVGSVESSARMLASGRVEAWLQSQWAISNVWRALGISIPLVTGDMVHEVPIFLTASPTLPKDVAAAYRDSVNSMRLDGTLDELWKDYISQ